MLSHSMVNLKSSNTNPTSFKVDFMSKRRYFPKSDQDSQEMESRSGHFNALPNELQSEILSYLPPSCDSRRTISGSTRGLIQYGHVSSKTRRAIEDMFSRRMHSMRPEDSTIYRFVKNPKLRVSGLRNILVSRKKSQEIYENPEKASDLLDMPGFCVANGYTKAMDCRWCCIDLIEFFCQFVKANVENKEKAFQWHLRQMDPLMQREEEVERRAFDVFLFIIEKSVAFAFDKAATIHSTNSVRSCNRELVHILERQDHFFHHKIVPLLNF